MITLYGSFPAFGLPQASPFVMKTEVQLKMAEIPYRLERGAPADGPKHKIPWIVEAEHRIGDSTAIRDHIEREYRLDLDRGLTAEMRARTWAIERMLEDHLYWAIVWFRWMDDANFAAGPAHFFDTLPPDIRDTARQAGRDGVRAVLWGQGIGRHAPEEIAGLGIRSLQALSDLLGNKRHLIGADQSAVDATAFAMLASATAPCFTTPLRDFVESNPALSGYAARMMTEYYPSYAKRAA